jgi:hypothetical protein
MSAPLGLKKHMISYEGIFLISGITFEWTTLTSDINDYESDIGKVEIPSFVNEESGALQNIAISIYPDPYISAA